MPDPPYRCDSFAFLIILTALVWAALLYGYVSMQYFTILGFNIFNIKAQQLRLGNINNLLKGFSSQQKKGFRKNYVYASLLLREAPPKEKH